MRNPIGDCALLSTLAAVAVMAVIIVSGAAEAAAKPAPPRFSLRIEVNDDRGIGAVGDAKLSLGEAIGIAQGRLKPAALSAAERSQITGAPGRDGTRIHIALGRNARIAFTDAVLPALAGMDGTVIDGGGAVLVAPTPQQLLDGPRDPKMMGSPSTRRIAFDIRSSRLTIENLSFENWVSVFTVRPPTTRPLTDLVFRKNHMSGIVDAGFTIVATTPDGAESVVRDVLIEGNVIVGPDKPAITSRGLSIIAGGDSDPRNAGGLVDRVIVRNNVIAGFQSGSYFIGTSGGRSAGGSVTNLLVENNVMRCHDVCIGMYANATFSAADSVSGGVLRNIRVIGNDLVSGETGAINLWSSGAFLGGELDRALAENFEIRGNTVRGTKTGLCAFGGIGIWAGLTEFTQKAAVNKDSIVRNVVIEDNRVFDCRTGIEVIGAGNHLNDDARVHGHRVSGVRIRNNLLVSNRIGLLAAAGYIRPNQDLPILNNKSIIRDNVVTGIEMTGNVIANAEEAISVSGIDSRYSSGTSFINNRIGGVLIDRNRIVDSPSPCKVTDELVVGGGGKPALLENNKADAACPRG